MSADLKKLSIPNKEIQKTIITRDYVEYGEGEVDSKKAKHRRKLHGVITSPTRTAVLHTAVVIGLNPSLANDQRSDHTFTKTGRYLAQYGVSDFYMLNLFDTISKYPRNIKPNDMTNWEDYCKELDEAYIIVAAWGIAERRNDIEEGKKPAIEFLKKHYKDRVYCVVDKNTGKKPLHPIRYSYTDELVRFFDN